MEENTQPAEPLTLDFAGLTLAGKVDALYRYVANGAARKMVTLPEPIVFIHENGTTSTFGMGS